MSKRVKINFESINKGNYTKIPRKDTLCSNERISKEMKNIINKLAKAEAIRRRMLWDKMTFGNGFD